MFVCVRVLPSFACSGGTKIWSKDPNNVEIRIRSDWCPDPIWIQASNILWVLRSFAALGVVAASDWGGDPQVPQLNVRIKLPTLRSKLPMFARIPCDRWSGGVLAPDGKIYCAAVLGLRPSGPSNGQETARHVLKMAKCGRSVSIFRDTPFLEVPWTHPQAHPLTRLDRVPCVPILRPMRPCRYWWSIQAARQCLRCNGDNGDTGFCPNLACDLWPVILVITLWLEHVTFSKFAKDVVTFGTFVRFATFVTLLRFHF